MSTALAAAGPGLAARRLKPALALAMLLIFSAAWVFPLTGESADAADGPLIRALFLPAYGLAAVLAALSPAQSWRAALRQPFLLALLAIAAASVAWSIAPDQTARRVFAVAGTTAGGLVLAASFRWRELAEVVAAAFAVLALAALAAALAFPSVGVMSEIFPGAWRGLWPEKNALGGTMALGFAALGAAAVLNPERARLWWGFAALALFLVLMSTSKTSLVALLLGGLGLAFAVLFRRGPAAGVALVWMGVLGLAMAAGIALFAAEAVFGVLGKEATLTGRTDIWSAAMRQIETRPWTGFGYGVVWDVKGAWSPFAWIARDAGFTPQHAHNAWLEQWLGLGLPGLTAFALFFLQAALLGGLALAGRPAALLAVPFLLVYGLMSITESIAFTYNDLRWVLMVAIAARLALPDAPRVDAARARA